MTNIYSTATEMAAALNKKEITSVELTKAHLERIFAVDGKLNAFLHVDNQGALEQAAAVDAKRAKGESLSPLAGVPIAVKDILAQKGIPTTCCGIPDARASQAVFLRDFQNHSSSSVKIKLSRPT